MVYIILDNFILFSFLFYLGNFKFPCKNCYIIMFDKNDHTQVKLIEKVDAKNISPHIYF